MNDAAPDQSMEDVLASIKRVMARDVAAPEPSARRRASVPAPGADDVLELRAEDQDDRSGGGSTDGGLSSPATVHATRRKLRSLHEVEAPVGSADHGVEGWVTELMKPMLRAWLDEHLPTIVETAVEREVRRITRG